MATNTIKIKAINKDDKTEVKAIIKHSMESGLHKNKETGEIIPANFIKEVKCEHNGSVIFVANWGTAVSQNPYLSFKFSGGTKDDTVMISWLDSLGDTDSQSTKIQ